MLESFLNNVPGLQARDLIKKRLKYRCFPVNIVKFFKKNFFIEHLWRLLLPLWRICKLWTTSILLNFLVIEWWKAPVFAGPVIAAFANLLFGNLLSQSYCFYLLPPIRKAPVIAAYWQISSVLMPIRFNISFLLTFCLQKAMESALYDRSLPLLLS